MPNSCSCIRPAPKMLRRGVSVLTSIQKQAQTSSSSKALVTAVTRGFKFRANRDAFRQDVKDLIETYDPDSMFYEIIANTPDDPYREDYFKDKGKFVFKKPKYLRQEVPFVHEDITALSDMVPDFNYPKPFTRVDRSVPIAPRRQKAPKDWTATTPYGMNYNPYEFAKPVGKKRLILAEELGRFKSIFINRTKHMNTFDAEMAHTMLKEVRGINYHPRFRTLIVSGAGERVFNAGHDWKQIYTAIKSGNWSYVRDHFRTIYKLNFFMATCGINTVTFMNGLTLGAGITFGAFSNYNFVTERTIIVSPETGLGFFPDAGSCYVYSHINKRYPGLGTYLALTGATLRGDDVLYAGIGTHSSLSTNIRPLLESLGELQDFEMDTIHRTIVMFDYSSEEPSPLSLHDYLPVIEDCFGGSPKRVEEIVARLTNAAELPSTAAWAKEALEMLKKKSPTALQVTLRAMNDAEKRDLGEQMKFDYRAAQKMMRHPDFMEGLRAFIIEKDVSPRWSPATLEEVSDSDIDAFFAPLSFAVEQDCDLILPDAVHMEDAFMMNLRRVQAQDPSVVEISA